MLRKFRILLLMNGVVPEKWVLLPQKRLKIPFFAQNIGEKGVILPWGSTFSCQNELKYISKCVALIARSANTLSKYVILLISYLKSHLVLEN